MNKILKKLFDTNWFKTIRFNFHYFPLKTAVKFPILVARHVALNRLEGGVLLESKPTTGMLLLGFPYLELLTCSDKTVWEVSGTVRIRGKIRIGRGSKFCVHGECCLGDRFTITGNSAIICNNKIVFDDNVLISWDVLIMDTDWHKIYDEKKHFINPDKPISVGESVWIGCRSTILKGSFIPSNSVIAACSTVSGELKKDGCIYSSNKKIIKEGICWER